MKSLGRGVLFSLVAALALATPGAAGNQDTKQYKKKYQTIEVLRFDIQPGVDFPADYLITMTEELVTHLQKTQKFKQVLREGETPADVEAPGMRLTGTVTKYKKGSRAKRYLIGFGAGKTKVAAHVQWLDRETGEVLFEADVDGKVLLGGLIKSESVGATRGLAKEVAKVTKKKFF